MYYFYSINTLKDLKENNCEDIYAYVVNNLRLFLSNEFIGLHFVLADELDIPYLNIMVKVKNNNCEIAMSKLFLEVINYILRSKYNRNTYEVKLIKELDDETFNEVINTSGCNEYFTEEVLLDNISDDDIVNKFNCYLEQIKSEGADLVIIDPYLLSGSDLNYTNTLINILKKAKAKKYTIITDQNNIDNTCKNYILKEFPDIEIIYTKKIHDRFWICNRKTGLYVGTSLNGIGRKLTLINLLKKSEVTTIVSYLNDHSIINSGG